MRAFPDLSAMHVAVIFGLLVLSFAWGALWHSRLLFGNYWKKVYYADSNPKAMNVKLMFGGTAAANLLHILFLTWFISGTGFMGGALGGLLLFFGVVMPSMLGVYLFASKPLKILAVDAGQYAVFLPVAGAVIGLCATN